MPEDIQTQCPYCGERVDLEVEELGPAHESYIEDCGVCCKPWTVRVERGGEQGSPPQVWLERDDD